MDLRISVEYKDVFGKGIECPVIIKKDGDKIKIDSNHIEQLNIGDVIRAVDAPEVISNVAHISFSRVEYKKVADRVTDSSKDIMWYLEDLAGMVWIDSSSLEDILNGLENDKYLDIVAELIDND